ncbi:MAG: hypothetical protein GY757_44245 [bacterium]|nr:hypothetical protein [bacterium]
MDYALEERIGNPDLFTGRKEELAFFLKWINDIKEKKSQSTAILARRKMGKTALLERLFNIAFSNPGTDDPEATGEAGREKVVGGVIPFYYEVKENKMWTVDFCRDFFLTFIYQYIAFKSRKPEYLFLDENNFEKVKQAARSEGLDYLIDIIESVEYAFTHQHVDSLWETVRKAPHSIAFRQKEFIVQMIDEFQFINDRVYRDRAMTQKHDDMAAGYLSTAESKIAPLLVSGSWVGWLMNELIMMLPARFNYIYLENMSQDEAVEMVFKYSRFFNVPVTEETAYLIAQLAEGSPFYISSVFRSPYKEKDLSTIKGLKETMEFETLNFRGKIRSTWMEYVASAFPRINDQNAKNIVLYLCKHRDREVTRRELLKELKLNITDGELEKRLKALVKADIISQGQSNYDYRGVRDNIFDKVFRGVYQKEISSFDPAMIGEEYLETFTELKKKYNRLQGQYNYQKGYFAEYVILDHLKYRARNNNDLLKSFTRYLPPDFEFCEYSRVWRYDSTPEYARGFNVDIFARSRSAAGYSIIGEVKSRQTKPFSIAELKAFEKKFEDLKKLENIERAVGFIFSRAGFTKEAETYCKEKGIACSEDQRWLENR